MAKRKVPFSVIQITMTAAMATLVFFANYLRIPFMDTKLTMANALCALAGLIIGPWFGFLSAGIGSFFFDIVTGYGIESLITFVSKGAIALVAGLVAGYPMKRREMNRNDWVRMVAGCVFGALTYVALYMLKTYIFGIYVNGLGYDATWIKMGAKLPGSLINAVFAFCAAPALFSALFVPLKRLFAQFRK